MWVKKKNVCDGEGRGRTLNTTMLYTHAVSSRTIPYSGKLSRISWFCGYSRKFSPRNLGAWCPLARHERAIHKSFLRENRIFHQFAKVFFLKSFPLYGTTMVYPDLLQMNSQHYALTQHD